MNKYGNNLGKIIHLSNTTISNMRKKLCKFCHTYYIGMAMKTRIQLFITFIKLIKISNLEREKNFNRNLV